MYYEIHQTQEYLSYLPNQQESLQLTTLLNLFDRTTQKQPQFNDIAYQYFEEHQKPFRQLTSTLPINKPVTDPYLNSKSYFKMYTNKKQQPPQQSLQLRKQHKQTIFPLYESTQLVSYQQSEKKPKLMCETESEVSFKRSIKNSTLKSSAQRNSEKQSAPRQSSKKKDFNLSMQSFFSFKKPSKPLPVRKQRSFSMKASAFQYILQDAISDIDKLRSKVQRKSRANSAGQLQLGPKIIRLNVQAFRKC